MHNSRFKLSKELLKAIFLGDDFTGVAPYIWHLDCRKNSESEVTNSVQRYRAAFTLYTEKSYPYLTTSGPHGYIRRTPILLC